MNFKYCLRLFYVSLLVFFTIPGIIYAAQNVSVKKDNVNVRTGPGTNFPVYMELFKGYPLKVIQQKGDWMQVSDFENDKGWIFAKLVVSGNTVIVNGKKSINMRTKPSTTATVVATVDRGVVLTKLSTKGKWTKVKHSQGTIGWIYNPLLWP
jgi:SH3-like domain-containing protein